ncbi:hypothetical protein I2492_14120 [Budviciaceae bacterium CWB-B4]|uniref:Uncharacterized protein n=1 Tax=Limnobaculum xujianqingii TaxID=2738837 RepID=A0A9D7FVE1_9GAMM|nr:hypothetical protein [Limnobaculum xujianqingii]MBK5074145.1 hypothetical protein [Limnobaculum xujianqingii]MBK5177454.1 hypothetical protein [Limnobaculum xujianqingii]
MQADTLIIIVIALIVIVSLISGATTKAVTKQSGMSIIGRVLIFSAVFGLLFFILMSIVLESF